MKNMEVFILLTNKELMLIQDNIKMSQSMTNFLSACSQSAVDAQLKGICQTMVSQHQKHIQTLSNYISIQNLQ